MKFNGESVEDREKRKVLFEIAQTGVIMNNCAQFGQIDRRLFIHPTSSETVLHVAARAGHLNAIRFFIEQFEFLGSNFVTKVNSDGKCALHEAAQNLHCDIAEYLIECGTNVDVLKRADWTPLMLACTRDHSESMVKLLLQRGANLKLRNKDGWTPFHIATRKGCVNTLKVLLEADPLIWRTVSNNRRTPLHTAAVHGHSAVLTHLLSLPLCREELMNEVDSCGNTVLMDAARMNSIQCCEILLNQHRATLSQLKEEEEQLSIRDKVGRNVLHVAAQADSTQVVDYLLRRWRRRTSPQNDIVNCCRTINGQTMLHLAAREGHVKTISYLISIGADVNAKDDDGCTAIELARRYHHEEAIAALNTTSTGDDDDDDDG